jgi:hypothetical protein
MGDTTRVNSTTVRQLQINMGPLPVGKETHPKVNQVPYLVFLDVHIIMISSILVFCHIFFLMNNPDLVPYHT